MVIKYLQVAGFILLPTKTEKTSGKTSGKILTYIKENNEITIPELAQLIGITERSVERNIQKLQEQNKLIRVGGAKGGFWKIPDK